jgi:hypothetical protein
MNLGKGGVVKFKISQKQNNRINTGAFKKSLTEFWE